VRRVARICSRGAGIQVPALAGERYVGGVYVQRCGGNAWWCFVTACVKRQKGVRTVFGVVVGHSAKNAK